ncbi:ribonuclease D [Futiania mangrovi]|uniref:Ribonuclease D n=1 Tax=Futiania mangrovi TaxID=2959716 RepID=A0A9J6PHW0_9PROT|nr:ribonuclease D [Futiania mangrovii]MCP1335666.1 ribonuclease D [Futiania mangrovii]
MIRTTSALADFCDRARKHPFVTVDTEFHRETTYWPKLCLVQIAISADDAVTVDPLAEGIDLAPLYALLADEAVLKVFHAARQDIEIFHVFGKVIPTPLFDTQIAAMVCGYGDQVAYDTLVRRICGVQIDKSSRFTDWARRPLNDKQVEYALADVTHLVTVYEAIRAELDRTGRADWVAEEMAVLANPATYETQPEDAWERIKGRVSNRRALLLLQRLAAWREETAQAQNVPRNRILKDDGLLELAHQKPVSADEMDRLRAVSRGFGRSGNGRAVLKVIEDALAVPDNALPRLPSRGDRPQVPAAVLDLLKVLLKACADDMGVAGRLVASAADLERLAAEPDGEHAVMHGWRREIFGNAALDLMAGRIGLRLKDGSVVLERD